MGLEHRNAFSVGIEVVGVNVMLLWLPLVGCLYDTGLGLKQTSTSQRSDEPTDRRNETTVYTLGGETDEQTYLHNQSCYV